jgi:hypothetical protein
MMTPENKTLTGSQLCADDQRHVLAAYSHRFTREHRPDWARKEWKDGKPYPVQFDSDADWLAHTRFAVRKNGRLDPKSNECHSLPTWPDNPELRKP